MLRPAHSLWAVHTETPNFLAKIRNVTFPHTRCLLRSAVSLRVNLRNGGRPNTLPFARAFAKPDFTRSAISDLRRDFSPDGSCAHLHNCGQRQHASRKMLRKLNMTPGNGAGLSSRAIQEHYRAPVRRTAPAVFSLMLQIEVVAPIKKV